MTHGTSLTRAARRAGNAVIGVPDRPIVPGRSGYREPRPGKAPGPVVAWLQWHVFGLSAASIAGLSAAMTHPVVAVAAAVPLAGIAVSDLELALNNARVRRARPAAEATGVPASDGAVTA